jgi:hypothetical protein
VGVLTSDSERKGNAEEGRKREDECDKGETGTIIDMSRRALVRGIMFLK